MECPWTVEDDPRTVAEFEARFATEEARRACLIQLRWGQTAFAARTAVAHHRVARSNGALAMRRVRPTDVGDCGHPVSGHADDVVSSNVVRHQLQDGHQRAGLAAASTPTNKRIVENLCIRTPASVATRRNSLRKPDCARADRRRIHLELKRSDDRPAIERLRISIPQEDPASVSRQEKADVLTFILRANEFPSGEKELANRAEMLDRFIFEAVTL